MPRASRQNSASRWVTEQRPALDNEQLAKRQEEWKRGAKRFGLHDITAPCARLHNSAQRSTTEQRFALEDETGCAGSANRITPDLVLGFLLILLLRIVILPPLPPPPAVDGGRTLIPPHALALP